MTAREVIEQTSAAGVCEFVDARGLKANFGIGRSLGYNLADAGLVKTVCLRKPGATRGKRLWVAESVRAYLLANIDQRQKEPACPPKAAAPAPGQNQVLAELERQNAALRARLAKLRTP